MALLKCKKLVQRFEHVVKKHNNSGIIERLFFQNWFVENLFLETEDEDIISHIFDQLLLEDDAPFPPEMLNLFFDIVEMESLKERRHQLDVYNKETNQFTQEDYDMMDTFDTSEELFDFIINRLHVNAIRNEEIRQMRIDAEPLNQFTPEDLAKLDTLETVDELFNFFFDRVVAEAERVQQEAISLYRESLPQFTQEDLDVIYTFEGTPEELLNLIIDRILALNARLTEEYNLFVQDDYDMIDPSGSLEEFLNLITDRTLAENARLTEEYNLFTQKDYDMMDPSGTFEEMSAYIIDRIIANRIILEEETIRIMEELEELFCGAEVVANMRIVTMQEKMVMWLYNKFNEGYELEIKINFDEITDYFIEIYWPFQYYNYYVYKTYESLIIQEYFTILIYLLLAILLSYLIIGFSYLFVVQNPETEKMSAYECGFEPYEDARQKFDVKFYIIAMLFIIFDIETMYLIPWCLALPYINSVGYFVMMEFILELCVSFLYVWYVGGLDWD